MPHTPSDIPDRRPDAAVAERAPGRASRRHHAASEARATPHPAVIELVRLIARDAAQEALRAHGGEHDREDHFEPDPE